MAGKAFFTLLMLSLPLSLAAQTAESPNPPNPQKLYQTHCALCHAPNRLGAVGPALLPANLSRLKKKEALSIVQNGREMTQMLGFSHVMNEAEIAAVVDWIYSPLQEKLTWDKTEIEDSHILYPKAQNLPNRPIFSADPENIFLVVETLDHHISVLDGDTFKVLERFPTRFALHGGPKFTENGRFVYLASRDGWISKYDLWNFKMVAEIRAGINTRNVAISPDGKHVIVANYLPENLVLLDGDLNLIKIIPATDRDGKASSRVSAVYDATPRQSFIAALKDVPEVWEISYNPQAPEIALGGWAHDYKMGEGAFVPGYLNAQRTLLDTPLDDFFFTQDYSELMGASRTGDGQVVNLDVKKKIAELPLDGMPHLGSGITWDWTDENGEVHRVMASTNLKSAKVSVIDLKSYQLIKEIPIRGPGFFLRSHSKSPYAFVDSMMSPAKNILQVIDKRTLKIVHELSVEKGKTLAHVEFTKDGRYALASLWENDGAIIVFDTQNDFKEVARLPMKKPVGKYNVYNKTRRDEGTSH